MSLMCLSGVETETCLCWTYPPLVRVSFGYLCAFRLLEYYCWNPSAQGEPWGNATNWTTVLLKFMCIPNIPGMKMFGGKVLEIGFDVIIRVGGPWQGEISFRKRGRAICFLFTTSSPQCQNSKRRALIIDLDLNLEPLISTARYLIHPSVVLASDSMS